MNWPALPARNDRHCGSPRMPGCLRAVGAAGVFCFPFTFLLLCILFLFPFWDTAAWLRTPRCQALFPPRYRTRRFLPGFLPCIVRQRVPFWQYRKLSVQSTENICSTIRCTLCSEYQSQHRLYQLWQATVHKVLSQLAADWTAFTDSTAFKLWFRVKIKLF